MRKVFAQLCFGILFVSQVTTALANDVTLQEVLTENQLTLPGEIAPDMTRGRSILLFDVEGASDLFDRKFFTRFIGLLLKTNGIKTRGYKDDFKREFLAGHVETDLLLAPKIIIQVKITQEPTGSLYFLEYRVSYFGYETVSPRTVKIKTRFVAPRELKGVAAHEIEDSIAGFLEKDLLALIKVNKEALQKPSDFVPSSSQGYQRKWLDPDNRRNHFFGGVSLGTPALVNLHFGFWGSRAFPLVAGLSGMYYSAERRGLQLDLGWAFDNTGSVKQVAGIALLSVNASSSTTSYQYDELGRTTGTTVETTNRLAPYVGPVYTLNWNDWHLQSGLAFKADPSSGASTLFLIQLGYLPAVSF